MGTAAHAATPENRACREGSGTLVGMASPAPRRAVATCAALLTLVSALASCSGGSDKPPPSPPTSSSPTPPRTVATTGVPTTPSVTTWPLTGLPRTGKLPDHPVYVVKVDNTSSADPQVGLDDADMVVEELVEGGITRLAAFYYSRIPDRVGPVRSMRASDIGIAEPAHAFIVASGAAGKTMKLLNEAGIDRVTEGAVGFYRSTTRYAPYNLMMKLSALAKKVGRPWTPPTRPYLPYGAASSFHGTIPVTSFVATFSGAHSDDWKLDGGRWVRTNSYAQGGHDFAAANILVLRVQVGDAGYLDPGGNPVPETFFYGTGEATLIHGDRAVRGTWHKNGTHGTVTLTDVGGNPITVPAGRTFIELVPAHGGSLTLSH